MSCSKCGRDEDLTQLNQEYLCSECYHETAMWPEDIEEILYDKKVEDE